MLMFPSLAGRRPTGTIRVSLAFLCALLLWFYLLIVIEYHIFSYIGCEENLWVEDGFCDDLSNVLLCDYDGGDCCLDLIQSDYCDDCICHLTGEKHDTIASPGTGSLPGDDCKH